MTSINRGHQGDLTSTFLTKKKFLQSNLVPKKNQIVKWNFFKFIWWIWISSHQSPWLFQFHQKLCVATWIRLGSVVAGFVTTRNIRSIHDSKGISAVLHQFTTSYFRLKSFGKVVSRAMAFSQTFSVAELSSVSLSSKLSKIKSVGWFEKVMR